MPNTPTVTTSDPYAILRRKVEQTLLLGRRRIEEAKVMTYLNTGKDIDEHLMQYESRGEHYGNEVVEKLSLDLDVSSSLLWRCVRFARSFKKILADRGESLPKNLTWSHYRKLITLADEEARVYFMQKAEQGDWSAKELGRKISFEKGETHAGNESSTADDRSKPLPKLIPKKGSLYTYRLIAPVSRVAEDRPRIDLGFQVRRRIPLYPNSFKENEIIESVLKDDVYSVAASQRTTEDLYTYKAFVERIVDGDTLIVEIDLGFETHIRQYLRLRGINAPELETDEGKKARDFVVNQLAGAPHIILASSRSDKYDRYLADVFYSAGGGKEMYLNQLLLDEGLAERR